MEYLEGLCTTGVAGGESRPFFSVQQISERKPVDPNVGKILRGIAMPEELRRLFKRRDEEYYLGPLTILSINTLLEHRAAYPDVPLPLAINRGTRQVWSCHKGLMVARTQDDVVEDTVPFDVFVDRHK